MKWLLAALTLSGCFDVHGDGKADHNCVEPDPSACASCPLDVSSPSYGTCGGEQYRCDATLGEWVRDGYCEPFGLHVRGDAMLVETGTSACLTIPDQRVFTFVDDGTVTAASPIHIAGVVTSPQSPRVVDAHLEADDVWNVVPVDVVYDLTFNWDGTVTGTGTVDAPAISCSTTLAITGSFEPAWIP